MTVLDTAIKWLDQGIATIPIKSRSKLPAIRSWKKYQSELPTLPELVKWHYQKNLNLAVICGWNYLTILDFDTLPAYVQFITDNPEYEDSYTISTSRGMHVYLFCPNSKTVMSEDIDIKANGYCLTSPSVHPSGKQYEVVRDQPIKKVDRLPFKTPSINECSHIVINDNHGVINININEDSSNTYTRRTNSIIQDIKQHLPITALFTHYHQTGDNMAIAHCPTAAHKNGDRHPSLSLDLRSNRAQCLKPGCPLHTRHGNDVIDCYAILKGLSLRQAIAEMANELGF